MTLKEALLTDLETIGIDTSKLDLVIRPYHKKYYGRFLFNVHRAYVYIYIDKEKKRLRSYSDILETTIHEATHYMTNILGRVVHKGRTHDQYFYDLFNGYMDKAYKLKLGFRKINDLVIRGEYGTQKINI